MSTKRLVTSLALVALLFTISGGYGLHAAPDPVSEPATHGFQNGKSIASSRFTAQPSSRFKALSLGKNFSSNTRGSLTMADVLAGSLTDYKTVDKMGPEGHISDLAKTLLSHVALESGVDECATPGDNNCSANATCIDHDFTTASSFSCTCNTGFSGDGTTCSDIDECGSRLHNCDSDATCTNTVGSFSCSCNAGFLGDGITCSDLDECTLGTHDCSADASCTNTRGSFSCTCNPGYDGDGISCTLSGCLAGTYRDDPANTNCTPASTGHFVAVDNATEQTECPIGKYQDQTGQTSCKSAPPGTFVATVAATQFMECTAGSYQPDSEQSGCLDAPIGTYVDSVRATMATVCPAGTTTASQGSTAQSQCLPENTITLRKQVTNDSGGTAVAGDFELTLDGASVEQGVATVVTPGQPVLIGENSLAGYAFESITGAGCPADLGQLVTLAPGQSIDCTIVNNDIVQNMAPVFSALSDQADVFVPSLDTPLYAALGPDGYWYISSFNARTISRVSADGSQVETFIDAGRIVANPAGVAFDTAGNFYFTQDDGNIYKVPAGSDTPEAYVNVSNAGLRELIFDDTDATLYVTGIRDGNIYAIDTNTTPLQANPIANVSFPDLNGNGFPTGVAVKDANSLYVTEFNSGKIWQVPKAGGPATEVASGIPGPTGLVKATDGDLYIASNTGNAIYLMDANGTRRFADITGPYGLAYSANGNLIVPQFAQNSVSRFPTAHQQSFTVEENQTAIVDLQSIDDSDSEGNGLSYSVTGGDDSALFGITPTTGELMFLNAPDFEEPQDQDVNNEYEVQVQVADSEGLVDQLDLTVDITDVFECPVTFPISVSNETELNTAIRCFNDITDSGSYEISLIADALLSASTLTISNSNAGVSLELIGNGHHIDGQGVLAVRPIDIAAATSVAIRNTNITGGHVGDDEGGGIRVSGNLMLISSAVVSNSAGKGGGIACLPGCNVYISKSSIIDNSSEMSGGGIYTKNPSQLSLLQSTVSGNQTLQSTSVGGGLWLESAATISNTTISGNISRHGGGGVASFGSPVQLYHTTIANNTASNASGLMNTGGVEFTGVLFALPQNGPNCEFSAEGSQISHGSNLDSDGSCHLTATGDIPNGNADLGPLQEHGGPTLTHALGPNSDAINAVDDAVCAASPVDNIDQRGESRPQGDTCDIGAFESRGPLTESPATMTVTEGDTIAIDLMAMLDGSSEADTGLNYALYSNGVTNDNALFSIDPVSGVILFDAPPDFEQPVDSDGNNEYLLQIEVTDNHGNSRLVTVLIIVTDDPSDTCDPASSERYIAEMTWYPLSLPCHAPEGARFADLLPTGRPGSAFVWNAYTYDALGGEYQPLLEDSPVPDPGVGFWFISSQNIVLEMPQYSAPAQKTTELPCPATGCYELQIDETTRWNLKGNPAAHNIRATDILIQNDSTSCSENVACTFDAALENDVRSAAYIWVDTAYGGEGGYKRVYTRSHDTQVVKPWDGFWIQLRNDAGETDHPWKLYLPPYEAQYVFVTDSGHDGSIGGPLGDDADEICSTEAWTGGLPGRYKAWLSSGQLLSPSQVHPILDTPYIRVDGALVAEDFTDLAKSTGLSHVPVNITPRWQEGVIDRVWTNTSAAGEPASAASHCSDWTDSSVEHPNGGIFGYSKSTGPQWTVGSETPASCDNLLRLYCIGGPLIEAGR